MHWIEDIEIIGMDLETTGLDPRRAAPVSAALTRHNGPACDPIDSIPPLIRPDQPIDPGAQAVHGIDQDTAAQGEDLRAAVGVILEELNAAHERGAMIVGANIAYDLAVLLYTGHRVGAPNVDAVLRRLHIGDALLMDRSLDPGRGGGRSLVQVCAHYGVSLRTAHSAAADARAAAQVFQRILHLAARDEGDPPHLTAHPLVPARLRAVQGAQTPADLHRLQRMWWREDRGRYLARRRGRGDVHHAPPADWPLEHWAEPAADGIAHADWWLRNNPGDLGREDLRYALAAAFEQGRETAMAARGSVGGCPGCGHGGRDHDVTG